MDILTLGLTQRNANQTQLSQERKLVVLFLKEVTITRTSFGRKWFPLRMNRSKLIFKVQMKFSFDEHSTLVEITFRIRFCDPEISSGLELSIRK